MNETKKPFNFRKASSDRTIPKVRNKQHGRCLFLEHLPDDTVDGFKGACYRQGISMREVILRFMRDFGGGNYYVTEKPAGWSDCKAPMDQRIISKPVRRRAIHMDVGNQTPPDRHECTGSLVKGEQLHCKHCGLLWKYCHPQHLCRARIQPSQHIDERATDPTAVIDSRS